jgi:hypothetical protein
MLNYADGQKVKVFKVEDKDTYTLVTFSTSRKDKRDGEYKYSNWAFVRFVGTAHQKASKLKEGSLIALKGGGESCEKYKDKEGNWAYPKNPTRVVFNFEFMDDGGKPIEDPQFEENHDSSDDDLPF